MIGRMFQGRILRTGNINVDVPIDVELLYDVDTDPLAVRMILSVQDEEDVVWLFSRDLLFRGINSTEVTGEGDIRFRSTGKDWPDSGVTVCLHNSTGHADIGLPHYDLMAFLTETEAQSRGAERSIDKRIETAIKEMLG